MRDADVGGVLEILQLEPFRLAVRPKKRIEEDRVTITID
jgi:hypothetical protein